MSFCENCGAKLPDFEVKFCRKCGAPVGSRENTEGSPLDESYTESVPVCRKCGALLVDGKCPSCSWEAPRPENMIYDSMEDQFRSRFIDPKERLLGVLGNSYLKSFLANGSVSKGVAVLTDKRVYFAGTSYEMKGSISKAIKVKKSAIADLCDITGTEIVYKGNIIPLIIAILSILGVLLGIDSLIDDYDEQFGWMVLILSLLTGIISFYTYLKKRVHTININYGGGGISYDLSWYRSGEVDQFRRALHLAKDAANDERYGKDT